MAPPIRMPAIGMTAAPRSGTVPLASTSATTGAAPPTMGRAVGSSRRRSAAGTAGPAR